MSTIFRVGVDAPTGSRPLIEGDSAMAHDYVTEGCAGLVEARNAILNDTTDGKNAEGKQRLVAKDRLGRQERFDRARALVAREGGAIESASAELARDAGLSAPPADSAEAIRAGEIRSYFRGLSDSEKLGVIHHGDIESSLALLHSPAIANLITDREREVITSRVLESHDAKKHAALQARREALSLASYSVEAGERWADTKSGIPATALRERLDQLNKSKQSDKKGRK
jgi:hypothetical protein